MITIAICNHKGGVGKTTTAFNLASKLAYEGAVVVLVDLDPQSNLTQAAGIAEEDARQGDVYKALQGKFVGMNGKAKLQTLGKRMLLNNEETNQETGELHIAPSTLDLSAAEMELLGEPGREFLLKNLIEPYFTVYNDQFIHGTKDGKEPRPFYCIIDCPPSLGLLTINALVAADYLLIPMQAEQFAVHGLTKVIEIANKVRERLNSTLKKPLILFTQYDKRKVLHRDIAGTLRSNVETATILSNEIRNNIALAEAAANGKNIFEYEPGSNGAVDYAAVVEELTNHFEKQKKQPF